MANQVALRSLTRPGDDVIVGAREPTPSGTRPARGGANAGVQFTEVGDGGLVHRRRVRGGGQAARPPASTRRRRSSRSRTRTTARGGVVCSPAELSAIARRRARARASRPTSTARGCWNAAVARGTTRRRSPRRSTSSTVALSKGLGAPGGSVLAGRARATSPALVRYRRMLGGAMRQVGHLRGGRAATRSTTTSTGWPRTTPTPAAIGGAARGSPAASCIDLRPARDEHRRLPALEAARPTPPTVVARARERGVLVLRVRPRAPSARSPISTSPRSSAGAADDPRRRCGPSGTEGRGLCSRQSGRLKRWAAILNGRPGNPVI